MRAEPPTPIWAAGAIALIGVVTYGILALLVLVWS
jgi:hypothetical protein